jgi:L-cysteine/cystine lyase
MPALNTAEVRQQLPATVRSVYLNTGTYGPLSRRAAAAMAEEAARDLEEGRLRDDTEYSLVLARTREALGAMVGAEPAEIALTRSTTEGVNVAIWGQKWSEADEVVTTSQEHPGVLYPLALLRRRYGVKVNLAEVGNGEASRTLEAFEQALHPGVKIVVLSHVLYTTGAVLPLAQIAAMAHAAGAAVLVDGAQSVGAVPVEVAAAGADYYAFSGQKWLCGPEGSGGLYVGKGALATIEPTFAAWGTVDFHTFDAKDPATFVYRPEASCLETGTVWRPAMYGLFEAVRWLGEEVGLDAAQDDIALLSRYCQERAAEIRGVRVLSPADQGSGLVALHIGDLDTAKAVEYLRDAGILTRNIHENNALRISTGFYNTKEEVDLALSKISEFLKLSR